MSLLIYTALIIFGFVAGAYMHHIASGKPIKEIQSDLEIIENYMYTMFRRDSSEMILTLDLAAGNTASLVYATKEEVQITEPELNHLEDMARKVCDKYGFFEVDVINAELLP